MDRRYLLLLALWVALPRCWCGAGGPPRPPAAAPRPDEPHAGKADESANARPEPPRRQGTDAADESTARTGGAKPNGDHAPSTGMLPLPAADGAAAAEPRIPTPDEGPLGPDTGNTPGLPIDLDAF